MESTAAKKEKTSMRKQSKKNQTAISFTLNGKKVSCEVKPSAVLLDVIRDKFELKGTKPGCNEGECGACTVLVNGAAINSCLYLAVNAHEKEIITIEGLLNGEKMDEVQQAMVQQGAVQCGFCSPGMIISIKSMQNHFKKIKHKPRRVEIQKMMEGNLCRCTGYVKIIEAAEKIL